MLKLKKLLLVAGTLASAIPVISLSSCNKGGSSVQKIDLDTSEASVDVYGHFADTLATYGTAYLSGFKMSAFDPDNLDVEVTNLLGVSATTKTTIIKNTQDSQYFDVLIEFESEHTVFTKTATFDLTLTSRLDKNDKVVVKDCCVLFTSYLVNVDILNRSSTLRYINLPNEISTWTQITVTKGLTEAITDISDLVFETKSMSEETTLPLSVSAEPLDPSQGLYTLNYKLSEVKAGTYEYLLKIGHKQLPQWHAYFPIKFKISVTSEPFYFSLKDNALTITAVNVNDKEVTIPATGVYDDKEYPIKVIGNHAFTSKKGIQKVNIGSNVETIESSSFRNCLDLEEVNIPASVTTIKSQVFTDCYSLTSLNVANENTVYSSKNKQGGLVDAGCIWEIANNKIIASTINPTFPEGVKEIGDYGLAYNALEQITLPETINKVGEYAFTYSTNLKSIKLSQAVTQISKRAFADCISLEKVELSSSTTTISASAFEQCYSLSDITIPSTVTSIGVEAFENCFALENIELSDGLLAIGTNAFAGCTSLKTLSIPSTVTSIGTAITAGCYSLTSLKASATNYTSVYGGNETNTIINVTDATNPTIISGCSNSTIPEGIVTIGNSAFMLQEIESITVLPTTLKVIEPNAFSTSSLKSIDLSNTALTDVGICAFTGCLQLTTVKLPNTVTIIDDYAFDKCLQLATINIPTSLITLGEYAFCDCVPLSNVTLPEGLTQLPDNCFANTAIKTITIPSTVTKIYNPFPECNELEEIIVADGNEKYSSKEGTTNCNCVYDIASNRLVCGCKNTVIPSTIKIIGQWAFESITSLKQITIPANVVMIDNDAFYECGLEKAIFENPNNWYKNGTTKVTEDLSDPVVAADVLNNNYHLIRKDS